MRSGEIVVRDLNSTNGTYINGEKVTESALKPGQILRLGQIEMRLETGEGSSGGTTTSKKLLDKTLVIPQGVKLDELEGTRGQTFGRQKGFERKTNKATIAFIVFAALVGLALIAALVWVVLKPHGQ